MAKIQAKQPFREEWVVVTPQMAQAFLDSQGPNRKIIRSNVELIKRDMLSGNYKVTHEGIAIDEDNKMIDGQHRCQAIVETQLPMLLRITYGVPRDAMKGVNIGRARSHADQFAVLERDETRRHASIAIMMKFGASKVTRMSTSEILDFIDAHRDAVDFAVEVTHGVKYASGPLGAAIARAYYYTRPEKLVKFMEAFKTGSADTVVDKVPIKLRIKLAETKEYGSEGRKNVYQLAERAIYAYIHNKPVDRIIPAKTELFVLPTRRHKTLLI